MADLNYWLTHENILYGKPHKHRKPKKIRLHKAHLRNPLLSHAKHPKAAPAIVSKRNPFRRTRRGAYITK